MLQAMWIHGNSVVPERTLTDIPGVPGSGMLGLRQGWGTTFRGNDNFSNWFHFSIPTPVLHEGERANLAKVFVLYKTDPQVMVTNVSVWDGALGGAAIFISDMRVGISGDHSGVNGTIDLREGMNMFTVPEQPPIHWGVGISVRVEFNDPGNITFSSAGANFDVTRGR